MPSGDLPEPVCCAHSDTLAEFAYNNAASVTMGVSPFFTNKGYHPRLTMDPIAPSSSLEAQHYVTDLDQLHSQLKVSITEARNATREQWIPPPAFKVSDCAYIKAKFF